MSEIKITQADRDLAGWFTRRIAGGGLYDEQAAKLIAKHRHEARAEALEGAAKVAEDYEAEASDVEMIDGFLQGCATAAKAVAFRIRALRSGEREG